MRAAVAAVALAAMAASTDAQVQTPTTDRDRWVAMARSGFEIPEGRSAIDLLVEMNPLVSSPDPVLRDDVVFGAAERWILRERRLTPADLRKLIALWTANLDRGLGERGDDRIFGRSFSALNLSLIAAADLSAPFLDADEVQALFNRMLDYFAREQDLRGFDQAHGWMHAVAHTSDTLKFLARNPKFGPGVDAKLLSAVQARIESHDAVFAWGENDRMAMALHSAVRRPDADAKALDEWTAHWVAAHKALWAKGPHIDATRFAAVENAKQVMRSLHAALSMEQAPTPTGQAAERTVLSALAAMR